jgi:hypothetical protein
MEELSYIDDYQDSREVFRHHYNEVLKAFNNSKEKETFESEFKIHCLSQGKCCSVIIVCRTAYFNASC